MFLHIYRNIIALLGSYFQPQASIFVNSIPLIEVRLLQTNFLQNAACYIVREHHCSIAFSQSKLLITLYTIAVSDLNIITMAGTSSLTFLHVTDIHDSFDNIKSLQLQLTTQGIKVDYVLVSGDISTMPMLIDPTDLEQISKYEHSVVDILSEVSNISPNVVYIPGNHDPIRFFSKSEIPFIKESIVNIHRNVFRLSDGLVVGGFGGSLPGYQSGEKVWNAFPHTNTELFEADIEPFLASIFSNKLDSVISPNDVIILMTHVGPNGFPSAIDYTHPTDPITCGSVALRKCLETLAQGRVILNIHGHTHAGVGHNRVGIITVSNPGPLQWGKYGLYKMGIKEGKWSLNSIHLESLH